MDAPFKAHHFEIEVEEDIIVRLRQRAVSEHLPASTLADKLLRKELAVHLGGNFSIKAPG